MSISRSQLRLRIILVLLILVALNLSFEAKVSAQALNPTEEGIFSIPDVIDFAKSPTQDIFAILTTDARLYLWNTDTQNTMVQLEADIGTIKDNPTWSPDGLLLAASCEHGACLWDTKTGKLLHILKAHPVRAVMENIASEDYAKMAGSLAFSPNGQVLATANGYDTAVILWDTETGEMLQTLYTSEMEDEAGVWDIQFSSNGAILAVGSYFSASLWTTDSWELIQVINAGNETMALSADGELFAIGFGRLFSDIEVWKVSTGEQLNVFQAPLVVTDLQWHSDNRTLLSNFTSGRLVHEGFVYTGSAIRAWDIVSSEEQLAFQITSTGKIAYEFASGETLIGIGSGNAADLILLWNSDTDDVYNTSLLPEKETEVQITSSEIRAYELSPDENFIGAGTDDGLVIIWDLSSGERLKMIQLNEVQINKIAWLSSGDKLVTLSDHTLIVWDLNQISY